MTAAIYSHYLANLAGKKVPIHANDPQPGHYKRKMADGSWVAASIFPAESGTLANIDGVNLYLACRVGNEMRDPSREWLYLAKNPVAEEAAFHFFNTGHWPAELAGREIVADVPEASREDGPDAVADPVPRGVGDNSVSGDPLEDFTRKATSEIEAATRWLDGTKIETQAHADILGDKYSALRSLWGEGDKLRVAESDPLHKAWKAANEKWKGILAQLDTASRALNEASTKWLQEETDRRNKERAELEAKQKAEAEAAAAKGEPAPTPAEPLPAVEPVKIGGTSGRKVGLTSKTEIVITDASKLFRFVKTDPAVLEAMTRAATALWREKGKVPAGCEIKKTQSAKA